MLLRDQNTFRDTWVSLASKNEKRLSSAQFQSVNLIVDLHLYLYLFIYILYFCDTTLHILHTVCFKLIGLHYTNFHNLLAQKTKA